MGIYCYCEKGHLVATVHRSLRNRRTAPFWARAGIGIRLSDPPSFCFECGAPTLFACRQCNTKVEYRSRYCGTCGKPLPWTENALTAAQEFTDEIDGLTAEDKTALKDTFHDLIIDTARTPLQAGRFMQIVREAGPTVLETFRTIFVDVISETAAKVIMSK